MKVTLYHSNGKIKYTRNYVLPNVLNGIQAYYYENGNLQAKNYYKNGKLHGCQLYYHPNGILQFKSHYDNGIPKGKQFCWYEDGKLKYIDNYKNGLRNGLQKMYLYNSTGFEKYCLKDYYKDGKLVATKFD